MLALFPAGSTARLRRPAAQIALATALVALFCAPVLAQTVTTDLALNSQFVSLETSPRPTYMHTGDFDGDTAPDVAVLSRDDRSVTIHRFDRTNKTFRAAERTALGTTSGAVDFGLADFNQDGKLDAAVATENEGVLILLGNGNGTFTLSAERYLEGQTLYTLDAGVITSGLDYDILVAHPGGFTTLVNDGAGGFNPVTTALPADYPNAYAARLGNFDGNFTRDVAVMACCRPGTTSNFYVLYRLSGDGTGNFGAPVSFFPPDMPERSTRILGDDLTVVSGTTSARDTLFWSNDAGSHSGLYGISNTDGGATSFRWNSSTGNYEMFGLPAGVEPVRGISGGGNNVAAVALWQWQPASALREFTFTTPNWYPTSPHFTFVGGFGFEAALPRYSDTVRADFNGDSQLDLVISDWTNGRLYVRGLVAVPDTPCEAAGTAGNGVKICLPEEGATVNNPFRVVARAWATYGGTIREYKIWVDGKQVFYAGTHYGSAPPKLDAALRLPEGSHRVTVQAWIGGDIGAVSASRNVTVTNDVMPDPEPEPSPAGCAAPSSPGVNICTPSDGGTSASPVKLTATAASTSAIQFTQVYVDGVKVFQHNGASIDPSLAMAEGKRRITVQARDAAGVWVKRTIYVTVQSGASQAGCSAEAESVKICSPAAGATQNSPVRVTGAANSSSGIRYMQVWVDGVRKHHVDAAQVDTSIAMASGQRRLVVTAVTAAGTTLKSTIYINVN